MKHALLAALALSLLAAVPAAGQQDYLTASPPGGQAKVEQRLNGVLPLEAEFLDQTGKPVRLGDYFEKGKPVIIAPVYYSCPMLCGLVLDGLVNSLHELRFKMGEEYEVVTFSFDPRDNPETATNKWTKYTRRYGRPGSQDHWHFLSGDEKNIKKLTDALGFRYTYDPATGQFAHAAMVIVATPDGRISRYFWGIDYDERDMRLGLVEASRNVIGGATEQLMLLCFQYDTSTGKYTAATKNFVRAGGAVTALGLGGFIFFLTRRDRVKAQPKRDE